MCVGGGGGGRRGRGRENMYLSLHCHHQMNAALRSAAIKASFNVSFTVKDKVTRQCPQTTTFVEKGEPKRNQAYALLLTIITPYR